MRNLMTQLLIKNIRQIPISCRLYNFNKWSYPISMELTDFLLLLLPRPNVFQ